MLVELQPHLKMHYSISDLAMAFLNLGSYFLTLVGLIYLLFSAQFVLFGAVLVSIIFVWLTFAFWRYILLTRVRPIYLKQFRNRILIGSAIATILSTVPRVLVYYLTTEYSWLLWYICLTFSVTIALTWALLVSQLKDRCKVFYEFDDTFLGYVNYGNLLLFFYGIFSTFYYTDGFWQILLCQAWFSVIGAASMAEFCQVARWKIKLILEEDPVNFQEDHSRVLPQENFSHSGQFMRNRQTENPFSVY